MPENVRGTKQTGLMAAWDWFATIAGLAGVQDITDHRGEAAGLPPVESLDMWPLLTGQAAESPRTELAIGDPKEMSRIGADTLVGALIQGKYKIVVGTLESSGWTGTQYPNVSSSGDSKDWLQTCGRTAETGCLFDIFQDPNEHVNIAPQETETFAAMLARVDELQKDVFSPNRGSVDFQACKVGKDKYGGFWGPWVGISTDTAVPQLVSEGTIV